jgi:hypothetical protein
MKNNYSEVQVQALTAAVSVDNPLTFDRAKELEATIGHSARSIVAKAKSLNLPYAAKVRETKTGGDVVRKEAIVTAIAKALGVSFDKVESLTAAKKDVLLVILQAVAVTE